MVKANYFAIKFQCGNNAFFVLNNRSQIPILSTKRSIFELVNGPEKKHFTWSILSQRCPTPLVAFLKREWKQSREESVKGHWKGAPQMAFVLQRCGMFLEKHNGGQQAIWMEKGVYTGGGGSPLWIVFHCHLPPNCTIFKSAKWPCLWIFSLSIYSEPAGRRVFPNHQSSSIIKTIQYFWYRWYNVRCICCINLNLLFLFWRQKVSEGKNGILSWL